MRAIILYGLLFIVLLSLVSAENQSIADFFPSGDATIMPPNIEDLGSPESEEPNDSRLFDMAAAESAKALSGESDGLNTLMLEIRDVNNGNLITNAHIRVFLDDGNQQAGTLRFVGDNGIMSLQLPSATWSVTLRLDITDTPGKDYYSQFQSILTGDANLTAFMQPVGSLSGDVVDASNNLVPNSEVKFECGGDYGETESLSTDQFGSFSADWLPIGSCKVSAINGKKVGSSTVAINQGQVSSVTVSLEKEVASLVDDYSWLLLLFVFVLAAVAIFMFMKYKSREKELPEPEAKEIKPDGHMRDVIQALDENERKIVEFLMAKGGESLQNRMTRELAWPKSSMSRALGGLEARNIIKTEKLGRVKRVELSEWFLNGKQP
jgi:hypothetical protein